jgi:hypothetical protein
MSVRLGCPNEYMVFVTDRFLQKRLLSLPFSGVTWGRVLDDVSEASITIPDSYGGLRCCNEIAGLRPWRYGIRIERDSELVWTGPITQIVREAGSDAEGRTTTISASDQMAWLKRRVLRRSILAPLGEDTGVLFKLLIDAARLEDGELECPPFLTGYTVYREYVANEFAYIYDLVQELADAAVDFTMIGDQLVAAADIANVFPGFGLITAEWFETMPGFTLDGWEQANTIYTPLPDSGEDGFRQWGFYSEAASADGVLDWVDTSYGDSLLDVNYATRAAQSIYQLRSQSPVVIANGTLSQNAAVSISQLIPGVVCRMDIGDDGCFSFLTTFVRLKRVNVTVSANDDGLSELVEPEWQPVGTEGLEGG